MLSKSSHGRYIVKGFHLPPRFFFCEVGAGIWPPPLPPPRTVSIKLSLECWSRPLEPTHTATLSSTQHLSPTASAEKETRSITLDSTAKGKLQRRVGGREAFYQQKKKTKNKKHTEQVHIFAFNKKDKTSSSIIWDLFQKVWMLQIYLKLLITIYTESEKTKMIFQVDMS